jgi:hypothetical protein
MYEYGGKEHGKERNIYLPGMVQQLPKEGQRSAYRDLAAGWEGASGSDEAWAVREVWS